MNYTSAYYLVYSQENSLVPPELGEVVLRNHEVSTSDKYLKDYYSSLIPADLKTKINKENLHLYSEIQ